MSADTSNALTALTLSGMELESSTSAVDRQHLMNGISDEKPDFWKGPTELRFILRFNHL